MENSQQNQKSFVCSFLDCKATFSKYWKLEAHLCKHTGLKNFSCGNCDKSFFTHQQLTRHELSHSGEKPYKCLVEGCSQVFVRSSSLKNHTARVHQHQEKRYKCDHQSCGKDFHKKSQLKTHKCEHQQPLPFHCSHEGCTKEFSSHGKLKHHEKVHDGYPCEMETCPFQGKTWTEYVKHKKEHKVKIPCEECKKLFNNTWLLHHHEQRVHSGVKKIFLCPGENCGRKFTRRFNLESHVLGDHEGKKPFSCAYVGCGKSFAMKESLWRHGVVHDPAKKKLKKVNPKKNMSPSQVQEVAIMAVVGQEGLHELASKLLKTTLEDVKC